MSSLHDYAVARGRQSPGPNRGISMSVTTINIESVEDAVSRLLDIDKDKAVRSGLRLMGNTLVSGGKKRLKTRLRDSKGARGNLFSSFKIRLKRRKLGELVGFNRYGHHAHLVNTGTKNRYTKEGRNRGRMPANNFWTDTAKEDWAKAAENLFIGIERAVNRIIERNNY